MHLVVTAHARVRMRQRRITHRMVRLTLTEPDGPYRLGKVGDEEVAERRFGRRVVQVVFEERKTGEIVVITVKVPAGRSEG